MTATLKIGELFAGYGGLGLGVKAVLGGEVAWFSEFDSAPSNILAHHWPDVPNHGDITKIDWSTVEPIDILTGGFPCQDVSLAGARAGLKDGTRSGLWSEFARAISELQPRMVVIENVRGLLSASAGGSVEPDPWGVGDGATRPVINALGAVLGDLASLGYDTRRCGVRAADAGAPHGRFRIFIVAHRTSDAKSVSGSVRDGDDLQARRGTLKRGGRGGASPSDANDDGWRKQQPGRPGAPKSGPANATSFASDAHDAGCERVGRVQPIKRDADGPGSSNTAWGDYEPAIRRWESVTGRLAPPPTNGDGKNGAHRLSARFIEWMMGLDAGHVTDPAIGLTRNEQLKALGNGVVPQQAALALSHLLPRLERAA